MNTGNFIVGIGIIAKYLPEKEKENWGVRAEHDQMWIADDEWVTNEEDRNRLKELGWFINEGSWSCFT